jgi:very-short-patch-repair endonuclease
MDLPDYRKRLPNARKLRQEFTDGEKKFWNQVKNRRLENHKFRRQVPIGSYIFDFMCLDRRLVIELDGGQRDENRAKDERRTHYLEGQGFRVIRFWNNEVLQNMPGVLEVILAHLARRSGEPPRPTGEGRGEGLAAA